MSQFDHIHLEEGGVEKHIKETKVIVALETKDNQIDFNFIELKKSSSLNDEGLIH